ncbi:MAG TPA: Lrp/AsnC family transcriptional regulator [Holophaga sp.]|nr:Lrp/AsnC family transcriptional regulator [Holophaga sp.]
MPVRKPPRIDDFDRAILQIIQKDNLTPLRVIGERVHLSAAAVQRRIRRMQEEGVIVANVAVVDPDMVGRPITILIEVHTERTHIDRLGTMKEALASAPGVQQCYFVTGDADFMLVLNVATMGEYERWSTAFFDANRNVKWFRTIVVMDRVKVGLEVPVI